MCKNECNPCLGCKKHQKSEAVWIFFTEAERQALEVSSENGAPVRTFAHS